MLKKIATFVEQAVPIKSSKLRMKKYMSRQMMGIAIITILCGVLFHFYPDICFDYYTNGLFALNRKLMNSVSLWVVLAGWSVIVFSWFRRIYQHDPPSNFLQLGAKYMRPLVWMVILFYWLWGFNYYATKPEDKMSLTTRQTEVSDVLFFLQQQTIKVSQLRQALPDMVVEMPADSLVYRMQQKWHEALHRTLQPMGYVTGGVPEVRFAVPTGGLLRFGTAGFFNFPIARPIIDKGLHPLQVPVTTLHEMAHCYGVADEASANFMAYIAAYSMEDPMTRYSAELAFFRSLSREAMSLDSVETKMILDNLSPDVRKDIIDIRTQMNKFPDLAPGIRDAFYDTFLKSQGVTAGIGSYDLYVDMVINWHKNNRQ